MGASSRRHARLRVAGMLILFCFTLCRAVGQNPTANADKGAPSSAWRFAVSGDSRNCGDVVMPAIASKVRQDAASFYWHLGDFRAIYDFDEDYRQVNPKTNVIDYENGSWPDFIRQQLQPFGDL